MARTLAPNMGILGSVSCIAWRIGKFILCVFNFFSLSQELVSLMLPLNLLLQLGGWSRTPILLCTPLEFRLQIGRHWASVFAQENLPQTAFSLSPFLPGFVPPLTLGASITTQKVLISSMFPACSASGKHPFIYKP